MNWKIPLFKIYTEEDDVSSVAKVIQSGQNWATGEHIEKLEQEVASYVGAQYAVAMSSGTAALHMLMLAVGIGKGDEVIVPSFSFIATANAPLFVEATPVFAEINEETYGLDPADVELRITPKTKAIMPMHYGGGACNIKALKAIAEKHNLLLFEDAAESLGTTVDRQHVGTFGDAGMYSFCAPKVITTGEGGIVVTNSRVLAEQLRLLRSHGRADSGDYFSSAEYMDYITLGYNARMSNILAALGRAQLNKLSNIIKQRQEKAQLLSQYLQDVPGIELPRPFSGASHSYQMYTIRLKEGREARDALQKHLNEKGIMAKVYFAPIHLTAFYRTRFGCQPGDLPATEKISDSVLTLPMYPELKEEEVMLMANEVKEFFHIYERAKELSRV